MLHFTVIDDGYGFKSPVGVLPDAAPCVRRLEAVRAGVVEQQERAESLAEVPIGEQRSDGKLSPTQ
jgi:hypothetical protein